MQWLNAGLVRELDFHHAVQRRQAAQVRFPESGRVGERDGVIAGTDPGQFQRDGLARLDHVDHLCGVEGDDLGQPVLAEEEPRERVCFDDPHERVHSRCFQTGGVGDRQFDAVAEAFRSTAAVVRIFCPVSSNDAGLPT
jgi:hypothetical protein